MHSIVSSKGQIVIPAAIREQLGLERGTVVTIRVEGGKVILDPQSLQAKLRRIDEMKGSTAGLGSGADLLLEDRRIERQRELDEEGW